MQLNYVLVIFVVVYLSQLGLDLWLEKLNSKHALHFSDRVPPPLEGVVDLKTLSRTASYTLEKGREAIVRQLVSELTLLVIVLCGFLPFLAKIFAEWRISFYAAGVLFFLIPGFILYILELPFGYYRTFVIEEKFGFNRSTLKIWIMDHIKSGLISSVLFCGILVLVFWLIRVSPSWWWLWSFLIVSFIQLLMGLLYPILIAPLFNKFEPIKDELLSKKIVRMVEENGIKVKKILQMNAALRSRHSNAYFTGLGKTKQIVLFDTLLESHPHDEILSVLAHEVGHYKKRHIIRQLLFFEISMLVLFYLTYVLINWPLIYSTFGFDHRIPYVGLFLIGIFWQKIGFFLQPFYMALSRRFERQADLFSQELLHTARPLISALKRMAADNLSNLTPHPLYVWFNYSHPPLIERIAMLEDADYESDLSERREGFEW